MEEINSVLLEELLGISNKRLKYIFSGQHVDEDSSSSTEPEEENKPIDVISLDDITDCDDDIVFGDENSKEPTAKTNNLKKIHESIKGKGGKRIKEEKIEKTKNSKPAKKRKEGLQEDSNQAKLMSVLELLELQARARAIRSQLVLESESKSDDKPVEPIVKREESDSDEVVIESPKPAEIVISSSDSEDNNEIMETKTVTRPDAEKTVDRSENGPVLDKENSKSTAELSTDCSPKKGQKVKIIRQKILPVIELTENVLETASNCCANNSIENSADNANIYNSSNINDDGKTNVAESTKDVNVTRQEISDNKINTVKDTEKGNENIEVHNISDNEVDEIVINVDESEVDGVVNAQI